MSKLQKDNSELAQLHRRISRHTRPSALTDRHLILRSRGRTAYIRIPRFLQAAGVLAAGAFVAWVVHTSYAYVSYDKIVSAKDAAISARDQTSLTLRGELDESRRSFAAATDSLEKNHKGLVALIGQNQTLKSNLGAVRKDLKQVEEARKKAEDAKHEIERRLAVLETHLENTKRSNKALSQDLKTTGSELTVALAEKNQVRQKGDTLNNRVGELQKRLVDAKETQTALIDRVADTSHAEAKRLTKILVTAGLNVKKMLRAQGVAPLPQGGPFEAAPKSAANKADKVEETIEASLTGANSMIDHLEGLQRIVRGLPLAPPLDYYYVSSRYGVRKDPINNTKAMHRGVDFGAKHRATVYSSAPGKVIYAGWKGRFGRFVEIDHGNGVITRYGHLRRIYVKRGQIITYRTKIAQMGNSGRSTGTHLHYEIHVNKRSVDPLKFMKAGKNVFKG
ncbi:MAG: murein DD-endopeptidase MepM/ murein hydrolase activator NlpD [Paracoccaceae bacterium]|jgi:murein DD-endopeptidase MepM/ murein hydrolase activator NlpD